MNKKLLSLILIIVGVCLYAADTRVTELGALGEAPVAADVLLLHDTSASYDKKVTASNLASYIGSEIQDQTLTFTDISIDIDANAGTIENLVNANIKAAAAIAVNKLAPLTTASYVVQTDGDKFICTGNVSVTELEILDGATVTTNELNILDDCTATAAELNKLDGCTSTVDELNILDGVTSTAAELNYLDGAPATLTGSDFNILDYGTSTEAIGDAGASLAFAIGGAGQWTMTAAGLIPAADDSEDIGSATNEIDDFWCDGIAHIDQISDDVNFIDGDVRINDNSGQYGFTVETDSDASALFIDGENNFINFGVGAGWNFAGFGAADATPDVTGSNVWLSNAAAVTITDFITGNDEDGQFIIVVSGGATTYDVDGNKLEAGTADLVTAAGDVTMWIYSEDEGKWYLISYMDNSIDQN